jgi:hypothetical protein
MDRLFALFPPICLTLSGTMENALVRTPFWENYQERPIDAARLRSESETVNSWDLSEATDRIRLDLMKNCVRCFLKAVHKVLSLKYLAERNPKIKAWCLQLETCLNLTNILFSERKFTNSEYQIEYFAHRCGIMMGEEFSFPCLGLQNFMVDSFSKMDLSCEHLDISRVPVYQTRKRKEINASRNKVFLEFNKKTLPKYSGCSVGDDFITLDCNPERTRQVFLDCGALPNNKSFRSAFGGVLCERTFFQGKLMDCISIKAINPFNKDRDILTNEVSLMQELLKFGQFREDPNWNAEVLQHCISVGQTMARAIGNPEVCFPFRTPEFLGGLGLEDYPFEDKFDWVNLPVESMQELAFPLQDHDQARILFEPSKIINLASQSFEGLDNLRSLIPVRKRDIKPYLEALSSLGFMSLYDRLRKERSSDELFRVLNGGAPEEKSLQDKVRRLQALWRNRDNLPTCGDHYICADEMETDFWRIRYSHIYTLDQDSALSRSESRAALVQFD